MNEEANFRTTRMTFSMLGRVGRRNFSLHSSKSRRLSSFLPLFTVLSWIRLSHCTGMPQIGLQVGACTFSTDFKPHVKSVTGSDDDLTQVIQQRLDWIFTKKSSLESRWNKPLEGKLAECRGSAVRGEKLCQGMYIHSVCCHASLHSRNRVKMIPKADITRHTPQISLKSDMCVGGWLATGIPNMIVTIDEVEKLCARARQIRFPSDLCSRLIFRSIRPSFGVRFQHAWMVMQTTD